MSASLPEGSVPMAVNDSQLSSVNSTNSNSNSNEGSEDDKKKPQKKRTVMACIRCRSRHIRCPGGNPCKKCQLARTKCEYVEADKKIVVSMKYMSKLHDDIARLKKENATLRTNLREEENKRIKGSPKLSNSFEYNSKTPHNQHLFNETSNSRFNTGEVIQPSLDKYGRLIQSRTGERLYVGSSSMTLFGLEIQNMVPPKYQTTPLPSPQTYISPQPNVEIKSPSLSNREAEIMEKEGNAYQIVLAKTNTRPGLSINFQLPSYSYAMLLVDNFINYNDGCFYFFNEGLVKRYIMNLYQGNTEENKKIMKRNVQNYKRFDYDENSIKKDRDDETILETMWFCKILLIFATGEMYLGTESDVHLRQLVSRYKEENKLKREERQREKEREKEREKDKKRDKKKEKLNDQNEDSDKGTDSDSTNNRKDPLNGAYKFPKNTLPGSGYFYQASELFTGLFASGAIDNITKDGGIEVMLLYAFFLQVADCTIASYFYFGLALRSTLILGWHVDAEKNSIDRFELEHRRRLWWTVYMYERMLSSKAGLPLSFSDDSVSTELPKDVDMTLDDFPKNDNDIRGFFIFPSAEYINNCVTITQINAIILSCLYTKQPTINILPVVSDLVHRLMSWKNNLPEFLKIDFLAEDLKISRLIVNLMTEYFQGINLAVRPLLFHFATKKLRELQTSNNTNKYVDLTKYSKNVLTLLNASFQASINTVRSIWGLLPENMVALFGWMDREYLFTSSLTLILFNSSFGLHDATKEHLDHALTLFTRMKKLGNYPAAVRRAQLLKLISVLDFNGVMHDLLVKHDDDGIYKDKQPIIKQDDDIEMDNFASETNDPSRNTGVDMNIEIPTENIPGLADDEDFASKLNLAFNPDDVQDLSNVYSHGTDLGIEGFSHLNEEQQLWNEITNDAVWLNPSSNNRMSNQEQTLHETLATSNDGLDMLNMARDMGTGSTPGGVYGDIINLEFHEMDNLEN